MFVANIMSAQNWVELDSIGKSNLINNVGQKNNGEGCFSLNYTIYNYTTKSTPINTAKGVQCKNGDISVVNIYGQTFSYSDSSITIEIDSTNKEITVSYNIALLDLKDRGQDAVAMLIENGGTIFRRKVNNDVFLKINSIEMNGINHYVLRLNSNNVLQELEIYYDEQEAEYYDRESEFSSPVLVIGFKSISDSRLEAMMNPEYFIINSVGNSTPSKRFGSFKINDSRIRTSDSR